MVWKQAHGSEDIAADFFFFFGKDLNQITLSCDLPS